MVNFIPKNVDDFIPVSPLLLLGIASTLKIGSHMLSCVIRLGCVPNETRSFQRTHTYLVDHNLKQGLKTSEFFGCLKPAFRELSVPILCDLKSTTLDNCPK